MEEEGEGNSANTSAPAAVCIHVYEFPITCLHHTRKERSERGYRHPITASVCFAQFSFLWCQHERPCRLKMRRKVHVITATLGKGWEKKRWFPCSYADLFNLPPHFGWD
jgi:hypothetical protein